ncbi:MAG: DUF975 family protein [Erysipelotrichaceae bacterium]|nr:DUF975 family protein [Erysipelotrichaceae bacterium]
MIDRNVLKERGKAAFKANYWRCVIVSLVMILFLGSSTAYSGKKVKDANDNAKEETVVETDFDNKVYDDEEKLVLFIAAGIVLTIVVVIAAVAAVVDIFVFNPLELGCKGFFLLNSDDPETPVSEIKYGFMDSYIRNVKCLFKRDLRIFLYSLLLIVPGIMKSLSYEMVPYILREYPDIEPDDALKMSEQMMEGHRWETFLLDLSFFGWMMLSVITAGIANVFYVNPYIRATHAELYKELKAQTE